MKHNIKNKIILFGFAGSGKSTIANLISKKFKLRLIHPSGIVRNLLEGKKVNLENTKYNTGFWETKKGIYLLKNRLNEEKPADMISDKIIIKEINRGNVVIDSWNLPWLTNKGIKIYLKANISTRAKRVAKRSKISYKKALTLVKKKDEETRQLFKRIYGFDIKKDLNVFDHIINTNKLTKREVFEKICDYLEK